MIARDLSVSRKHLRAEDAMTARTLVPRLRLRCICALLCVGALSVCTDQAPESGGPDLEETPLPTDAQISNLGRITASSGARVSLLQAEGDDGLVYVSLPVGVVASGISAEVRRKGDEVAVITKMQDGGFDPVAVVASAGDSIQIVVKDGSGQVVFSVKESVKLRRPPTVVRIWPPRRKADMPMNASIVVVFSEPINGGTVSSSTMHLFAGRREIAGQARLLEYGTSVAFTPNEPLSPLTEYRLVLGASIADLEGDALGADVVLGVRTGTSTLGPPARIVVAPDSIVLLVGSTYQFSARVFDADGNLLLLPVTWRTSTPDVMSISPTGLVTAVATTFSDRRTWGIGRVEARVATLSGAAFVVVVPKPETIKILPSAATVSVGDTLALEVVAQTTFGYRFVLPLTVTNSNAAAVSVSSPDLGSIQLSPFRTVRALAPGEAHITLKAGGVSGTTALTITQRPAVNTVRVAPAAAAMMVQESLILTTWLRDADGRILQGTSAVSWSSSNTSVATVNGSGKVTALAHGAATITAATEAKTGSASIEVTTQPIVPKFIDVESNHFRTCGVTATGDAYCWGSFVVGTQGRSLRIPTLLPGGLHLAAVTPDASRYLCGRTSSGDALCWSNYEMTPNHLAPTLKFSDLKTSEGGHGCAVATNGSTYCWGENLSGQLGDGTTQSRAGISIPVAGGYAFKSVVVGRHHSCGLTAAGEAYCWGANKSPPSYGEYGVALGTGDSTTSVMPTPSPVAGGLAFAQLSAGFRHTCGITVDGRAYCWGGNANGQLGDGTQINRNVPVAVATSLTFSAISVDAAHSCAITTSGAAYCWGDNSSGALGVDTAELMSCGSNRFDCSRTPVAVQGNVSFVQIAVGIHFSCGTATTGQVYCWGDNRMGQLGDGSDISRSAPMPVSRP